MRDKLIRLCKKAHSGWLKKEYDNETDKSIGEYVADYLIANGVTVRERGEWIVTDADSGSFGEYEPFIEFKCPKCESGYGIESGQYGWQYGDPIPWVSCPLCAADMRGE